MNGKKYLLTILIVYTAVTLLLPSIHIANAQPPESAGVEVTINDPYFLRGDTGTITIHTNPYVTVTLEIFNPNYELLYSKQWTTDEKGSCAKNLPISETAEYGTYTIKASLGETITSTWFTVLDITNWSSVTFPYSRQHGAITYTFHSNATLFAQLGEDKLIVDLSFLREIEGLSIIPRVNSMNFLARFKHEASGFICDLDFAFIHCGCKIILNGSLSEPKTFIFNVDGLQLKEVISGIRVGHIVFDWTDFRKAKHHFTYDHNLKRLSVEVPKTFRLDPYIFEDGFESGDFSAWSQTTGSPTVTSGNAYQGTYKAVFTATNISTSDNFTQKDFGSSYNDVWCRSYVRLNNTPPPTARYLYFVSLLRLGAEALRVGLCNDGTDVVWVIRYRNASGNAVVQSSQQKNPSVDTWYCIEIAANMSSSDGTTDGEYHVYIDGTELTDLGLTNLDTDYTYVSRFTLGIRSKNNWYGGGGVEVWADSVVIDDEYIGPVSTNNAPTIGEFEAPTTVYANQYFYLNATADDQDGISEIINATIEISNDVILKWDNATANFSEYSDTNGYCSLDATGSIESEKNSTAFDLSWKIKLNKYPSGSIDVVATNTKVWDSTESGSGSTSGLFTFSYITLTLQARDKDGTNLPRQVTFKGTLGNGTSFEENSNSNALKILTTCYGSHTINTWWSTHLIDASHSVSVTSDKTENINTKIARLSSGSYYILISINQTTLPSPSLVGTKDWKMLGVSGSGFKQLKMDSANWVTTTEPETMKIDGNPYEKSAWTWDPTNKILTRLLDLTGTAINIEMSWDVPTIPSGTTTTVTVTPVTPITSPEEQPSNATQVPVTIIPEYNQTSLEIPKQTVVLAACGVIAIVVIAYGYNWVQNQGSLAAMWKKKEKSGKKPNWRKKRR